MPFSDELWYLTDSVLCNILNERVTCCHKGVYMQMATYPFFLLSHAALPPDNFVVRAAEDFHEV